MGSSTWNPELLPSLAVRPRTVRLPGGRILAGKQDAAAGAVQVSDEVRHHVDVAAGGLGVGAGLVSGFDERLGDVALDAR